MAFNEDVSYELTGPLESTTPVFFPDGAPPYSERQAFISNQVSVSGRVYELLEFLGRGGNGDVHRALDLEAGELRTLKVMTGDNRERLDAMHQALCDAGVRIPSKVQQVLLREGPYRVQTHHEGVTMVEVGRQLRAAEVAHHQKRAEAKGRMQTARFMLLETILEDLLDILEGLAEQGLVHRDVKPSNILVARQFTTLGKVTACVLRAIGREEAYPAPSSNVSYSTALLDPDLLMPARSNARPSGSTSGLIYGSPAYMSPEAIMAEPLTPANDIFSMGALILTALEAHKKLFPGLFEKVLSDRELWDLLRRRLRDMEEVRTSSEMNGKCEQMLDDAVEEQHGRFLRFLNLALASVAEEPRARPTPIEARQILHDKGNLQMV